jgi:hypothetical protein
MIAEQRFARFILLFLLVTLCANIASGQTNSKKPFPKIKMLLPKTGDELKVGDQINIAWEANVPKELDINRCEQEIYLSLDGGRTLAKRITGHLAGSTRNFLWTVPDLPTDQAVLMFRFGSQTGRYVFEKSYLKKSTIFRIIRTQARVEKVELTPLENHPAQPGQTVEISWQSNIANLDFYEVMISYDQGAHFQSLTRTAATSYRWTVPTDFVGNASFQIVAQRQDGSRISTVTDAEPNVLVTR